MDTVFSPSPEGSIRPAPSLGEMTAVFARIGLLSFGGPAGQIALMHRELVDERGWISEDRFQHALNYCMLLPGPEAQQLATYIGWFLHGVRGGVIAGLLFILPGFMVILGLSTAYALYQETGWLEGVFFGLKAAVLAIVVDALIRVGRRTLKTGFAQLVALLAFLALFVFNLPFPLVILAAGLGGLLVMRLRPDLLPVAQTKGDENRMAGDVRRDAGRRPGGAVGVLALWGGLWAAPFLLIIATAGPVSVFFDIALFFSQMAVVTFGGAYAVLAYVAQEGVATFGWLRPGEMVDGLALAETTPGPLVLVLSFVGFMGAFRDPGLLHPVLGGLLGATLAAWVTFVPCFLWIFLGAPYIDRLRANRVLAGALLAISAAVSGVILNLALWFALHVLFARDRKSVV